MTLPLVTSSSLSSTRTHHFRRCLRRLCTESQVSKYYCTWKWFLRQLSKTGITAAHEILGEFYLQKYSFPCHSRNVMASCSEASFPRALILIFISDHVTANERNLERVKNQRSGVVSFEDVTWRDVTRHGVRSRELDSFRSEIHRHVECSQLEQQRRQRHWHPQRRGQL